MVLYGLWFYIVLLLWKMCGKWKIKQTSSNMIFQEGLIFHFHDGEILVLFDWVKGIILIFLYQKIKPVFALLPPISKVRLKFIYQIKLLSHIRNPYIYPAVESPLHALLENTPPLSGLWKIWNELTPEISL